MSSNFQTFVNRGVENVIHNTSYCFSFVRDSITKVDATHEKYGDASPKQQLEGRIGKIAWAAILGLAYAGFACIFIHQGYSIFTNALHPFLGIVSFAGAGITGLIGIVNIKEIVLQSIAIHREKTNS